MKFTAEQRKHLVTRTFTENTVTYTALKWADMSTETHTVKVGGKFEDESALKQYVMNRYSTQEIAINPMTISYKTEDVKYGIYDYDFLRYGFKITEDEDEG